MTKEKIINAFGTEGLLYEYLESFFPNRWDVMESGFVLKSNEGPKVLEQTLVVYFPEIVIESDQHNFTHYSKEYYLLFYTYGHIVNVSILKMHFTPEEHIKAWIHPHVGLAGGNASNSHCWGNGNTPIANMSDNTQGIVLQFLSYMTTFLVAEHTEDIYDGKGIGDMLALRNIMQTGGKYIYKMPIHLLAKLYDITNVTNLLNPNIKHVIRSYTNEENDQIRFQYNSDIPSNGFYDKYKNESIMFRGEEVKLVINESYELQEDNRVPTLILDYVKENKLYIINKLNFFYEKFRVARKFNLA
jgi:hypothetical protein